MLNIMKRMLEDDGAVGTCSCCCSWCCSTCISVVPTACSAIFEEACGFIGDIVGYTDIAFRLLMK